MFSLNNRTQLENKPLQSEINGREVFEQLKNMYNRNKDIKSENGDLRKYQEDSFNGYDLTFHSDFHRSIFDTDISG
jgi:hypothetical protein